MSRNTEGSVLIVDDDATVLQLYKKLLQEEAAVVATADSVKAMEELITRQHFDVMLLDLMLGEDYGLDHFKIVLEKSPRTRIIILTENASIEAAVTAMQMGASNFLKKSSSPRTIVDEVRAYL